MMLSRLCLSIAVVVVLAARASAADFQCSDAPRNAMYRVVADGCPGDSARRLSTGFRAGSSLYAALHGILGCKGEIVAYPPCPIAGYDRIVVVPKKVAKNWDLVQLSPKTGSLKGPDLVIKDKRPNDQEKYRVCGYPTWNHMQATCSQPFAFDHSQAGVLRDLLKDGGDTLARSTIKNFGLPDLNDVVLWHEALGGGGVSGGPLVVQGNRAFAVHDGRFDSQGRERFWAIPLSSAVVWQDWKTFTGDAETRVIVSRALPGQLHVAPVEDVTQTVIQAPQAQQFLSAFFESVFSAYGCEWMRTGSEIANHVCATGAASCQSRGDRDDGGVREVCPQDCVLGVYKQSFEKLKPVSQMLCQQFATEAEASPATLGCSQPDNYTWFLERKKDVFGNIFFDSASQFALMRDLYFSALPDERRDALVAKRFGIWADDARKRQVVWRLDGAKAQFEQWRAAKVKPFEIQDRNGLSFYIDPADDWAHFQSHLFEFVARAVADKQVSVVPTCTNARMIFDDVAGTWTYTIGRDCPSGRCLAFDDRAALPRIFASKLASALAFGGAVKMDDVKLQPIASLSPDAGTTEARVRRHATAHMTGPLPVPGTSLDLRVAPCAAQPTGLLLRSCALVPGPAPNGWTCEADADLSEECPTVEARVHVGDAVVRRKAISLQQE